MEETTRTFGLKVPTLISLVPLEEEAHLADKRYQANGRLEKDLNWNWASQKPEPEPNLYVKSKLFDFSVVSVSYPLFAFVGEILIELLVKMCQLIP